MKNMRRNQVENVIETKKRESIELVHTHTNSLRKEKGITLIALVITIVLNSSYLAMDRMNRFEKI